jgi:hypothetical protein
MDITGSNHHTDSRFQVLAGILPILMGIILLRDITILPQDTTIRMEATGEVGRNIDINYYHYYCRRRYFGVIQADPEKHALGNQTRGRDDSPITLALSYSK